MKGTGHPCPPTTTHPATPSTTLKRTNKTKGTRKRESAGAPYAEPTNVANQNLEVVLEVEHGRVNLTLEEVLGREGTRSVAHPRKADARSLNHHPVDESHHLPGIVIPLHCRSSYARCSPTNLGLRTLIKRAQHARALPLIAKSTHTATP